MLLSMTAPMTGIHFTVLPSDFANAFAAGAKALPIS
jgi:hypothetical protein